MGQVTGRFEYLEGLLSNALLDGSNPLPGEPKLRGGGLLTQRVDKAFFEHLLFKWSEGLQQCGYQALSLGIEQLLLRCVLRFRGNPIKPVVVSLRRYALPSAPRSVQLVYGDVVGRAQQIAQKGTKTIVLVSRLITEDPYEG